MFTGEDIARQYGDELLRFCRRMVYSDAIAEDIVQDVLTIAWQQRHEKQDFPGSGNDLAHLRGWLYRVARNRSIDVLRKMKPQERLSAVQSCSRVNRQGILVDPVTTPAGRSLKRERIEHAQAALDSLEDDLRSVIIMRIHQGLSRDEIAQATGLTIAGVKARLSRALKLMQSRLEVLESNG